MRLAARSWNKQLAICHRAKTSSAGLPPLKRCTLSLNAPVKGSRLSRSKEGLVGRTDVLCSDMLRCGASKGRADGDHLDMTRRGILGRRLKLEDC